MNKISIVIPNRNGSVLLRRNLSVVIRAAKGSEIIVVDDASTDDSVNILRKEFPDVKVIRKDKQEGFASTANAGVSAAIGDIVILLNSDIRPEKNFLSPLVFHFRDPKVFAVSCMDKSIEKGKTVLRGRGLARWERGMYVHSRGEVDKTDTAWVSGGSGAFRKSLWVKLGGMDPIFNPFYWEDIDLSCRAIKAGYTILFEPKSVVIHEHEAGAIQSGYSPEYIKTIAYRNQFLFVWKNLSGPIKWIEHIAWNIVRFGNAIGSGNWMLIKGFCMALLRLL